MHPTPTPKPTATPAGRRATPPGAAAWLLAALLAGLGLASCGGGEKPQTAADTASLPTATPAPSAPAPTPPPSRPPKDEPRKPKTTYVIEEHEDSIRPSLGEAARRARERQEGSEAPRIRVTDENLSEYATGRVTVARPGQAAESDDATEETPEGVTDLRTEEYWRQGARELRLKLRRAWEEAQELEEQAAGLRIRFYAEDDPYVRDSRIKPAWDRALEGYRQAIQETRAYRRELSEFLERGRRAGALPGWLREGVEYEPDLSDLDAEDGDAQEGSLGIHEPQDPQPMERRPRDPGGGGGVDDRGEDRP